jgi:hypothetical protein
MNGEADGGRKKGMGDGGRSRNVGDVGGEGRGEVRGEVRGDIEGDAEGDLREDAGDDARVDVRRGGAGGGGGGGGPKDEREAEGGRVPEGWTGINCISSEDALRRTPELGTLSGKAVAYLHEPLKAPVEAPRIASRQQALPQTVHGACVPAQND